MTKQKLYRYIGYNGVITSPVLLEDVKYKIYYELRAGDGKILTNNDKQMYCVIVPEEEINLWHEIDGYDDII